MLLSRKDKCGAAHTINFIADDGPELTKFISFLPAAFIAAFLIKKPNDCPANEFI